MKSWDNELLVRHDDGKVKRIGWNNALHFRIINILFAHILKDNINCYEKVDLDDINEIKRRLHRFVVTLKLGPDIVYLRTSIEQGRDPPSRFFKKLLLFWVVFSAYGS